MAQQVRAEAGIGTEPVTDIFSLMERLDIIYLRYPLGDRAIEGYAARRGGRNVVFTNNSYPRGKEIFTAAHEIAHLYLDVPGTDLIVDETITFDTTSVRETRANYFAAHFLMPTPAVVGFMIDFIGVEPKSVTAKDLVALQQHFRVSYKTALIRLNALGLITKEAYEKAALYGGCASLTELVKRCGYETELLVADNKIHVPAGVVQKAIELYEQERIPFGSIAYFLKIMGREPSEFGLEPQGSGDEDAT